MKADSFFDDMFSSNPSYKGDYSDNFSSLGVSKSLEKALSKNGFISPTDIQKQAIPLIIKGADIFACAKTGSGKTLAFSIPIIERLKSKPRSIKGARALIILPTRELASQVYDNLLKFSFSKLNVVLITGGELSRKQESLLRSGVDVIVCTPGRIIDHIYNCPSFGIEDIEILVLDEADRLLDDNFKDQLSEIVKHSGKSRQTLLFSATLTDEVKDIANLALKCPIKVFVDQSSSTVETLTQSFVRIKEDSDSIREALASLICSTTNYNRILIFCETKIQTHRLFIILKLLNLMVGELHGNMTQIERTAALDKFRSNETRILIATGLASRGLDIEDINLVINVNLPKTYKDYIHRVGRTARAGREGKSITFINTEERKKWKGFVKMTKSDISKYEYDQDLLAALIAKISSLSKEINDKIKSEKLNIEFRNTSKEIEKTENLLKFNKEIMSRPKRTFMNKAKKYPENNKISKSKKNNIDGKESKAQYMIARNSKKSFKQKRLRYDEGEISKLKNYKKKSKCK